MNILVFLNLFGTPDGGNEVTTEVLGHHSPLFTGVDYDVHFDNFVHRVNSYFDDIPSAVLGECVDCGRYCTISSFSRLCEGCTLEAQIGAYRG